jgi:type IV secretory pathway protease TraF
VRGLGSASDPFQIAPRPALFQSGATRETSECSRKSGSGPGPCSVPDMLSRPRMRLTFLLLIAAIIAGEFMATSRAPDLVLFNHSASLPTGFYVRDGGELSPGVLVTVRAADAAPLVAKDRGFEGPRDRFLKHIAAVEGDEVCADVSELVINGTRKVTVKSIDRKGQPLDHCGVADGSGGVSCCCLATRRTASTGDTGGRCQFL